MKFIPHSLLETSRSIIRRLPRRHRRLFWILLCGMVVAGVFETLSLGMIAFFVSGVTNPEAVFQSSYYRHLQGLVQIDFDTRRLMIFLSVTVVCLVIVKNCMNGIIIYAGRRYSGYAATFLGEQMLKGFLSLNYEWHLARNTADLSLGVFWRWYYSQFLGAVLQSLSDIIIVLLVLSAVFFMEPAISILVVSFLGLSAFIIFNRVRKNLDRTNKKVLDYRQSINREVTKAVQGIKDVKIYGRQQFFVNDYRETAYTEAGYDALQIFLAQCPQWILEAFGFLMLTAAICFMMFYLDLPPARVTGTIALLSVAAWRTLPALNKILNRLAQAQTALPFVHKGLAYIHEIESNDHDSASGAETGISRFTQSVKFNNVSFKYHGSDAYAVCDLDFSIAKGKTIGIIGASGAGKSTFIDLLIGLLSPTSGRIDIDGKRLERNLFFSWTRLIGYVAQSPYIFEGTVIENVAFGLKTRDIDREKAIKCCEMAAMGDFLHDLPRGIDTKIGERGVTLSGGQRQRVAIARALYNNPEILIFDEATSSLDTKSEKAIQRTIYSFKGKQTLIIIAHRLSTVEDCDEIFWLEKGKIRQIGTPDQVLPVYRNSMRLLALGN